MINFEQKPSNIKFEKNVPHCIKTTKISYNMKKLYKNIKKWSWKPKNTFLKKFLRMIKMKSGIFWIRGV